MSIECIGVRNGRVERWKLEEPVNKPYRAPARITNEERLDDHDGRLDVLEFFADGREKCSGDELWDNVERMNRVITTLRWALITIIVMFAVTIFGHLYFTERLVNESEARFQDNHHKLQCIERQLRANDEQLKELRVLGYKTLDTVGRP
jgi:hypothetical protein